MTTPERLERNLPSILGDLAMGSTPDYIDDVLGTTARARQRPAWTFPERWLPMADITTRQAIAPRAPFRAIGVALVILALIIAAALVYVGSHQTRLAPFGPAANGLIPYASNGDIYLGDPVTGQTRLLVGGPDQESGAVTSADGTQVAFARDVAGTTLTDVYVVRADGSALHKITPQPIDRLQWGNWTPDGRQFALIHLADDPTGCATTICVVGQVDLVDAAGSGTIRTIAKAPGLEAIQFRPPDGGELLYRARVEGRWGLFAMDPDGGNVRAVVPPTVSGEMDQSFRNVVYTPDGSRIFYQHGDESGCCQLWVVNADGTDPHEFVHLGPAWDGEAVPSPDGKWIAYWHNANDGPAHGIAVVRTRRHRIDDRDRTEALGHGPLALVARLDQDPDVPQRRRHRQGIPARPRGRSMDDAPLDVERRPRLAAGRGAWLTLQTPIYRARLETPAGGSAGVSTRPSAGQILEHVDEALLAAAVAELDPGRLDRGEPRQDLLVRDLVVAVVRVGHRPSRWGATGSRASRRGGPRRTPGPACRRGARRPAGPRTGRRPCPRPATARPSRRG